MTTESLTRTPTPASDAPPAAPTTSPRRAARIAGIAYLLIFGLAIAANFGVRGGLVVNGDAAATTANIAENLGLFRLGTIAFLAVFILDVVVAWALHVVFRGAHHDLSLLTAWSRLTYTVLLGVALVFFVQVPAMLATPDYAAAVGAEATAAQVLLAVQSFDAAWLIGLAVFGVHLVLLGALVLRSGLAPRAVAVLLMVAGVAYVLDTVAHVALPDYGAVAGVMLAVVAVPSMIGEGWLGLWLLATRRIGR
ncbi:MAG: DUF4386 domain-containing protein [Actinomycetales bacterium]|nr:DUF4386 domain-containing protein [Actinomycetales bacterium]